MGWLWVEDQLGWEGKVGTQRKGGRGGKENEECGEKGESQGWHEGMKHGKRRHLVQYGGTEWKNRGQDLQEGGGANTSTVEEGGEVG